MKSSGSRIIVIVVGLLLLFGSVGAIYVLGNFINPPGIDIFVSVKDISAGEVLMPHMVELRTVQISNSGAYVTADNIEFYGGAVVADPIYAGEFIPVTALAVDGSPASAKRVSLGLGGDDRVAIVVPVNPYSSPQEIVSGDRVDIDLAVGSAAFLAGSLRVVPTPDGANEIYATGGLGLANIELAPTIISPFETPEPTTTPQSPITLPVAKRIVSGAPVLQVLYEEVINPSFSPDGNEPQTSYGDIRALVLSIPRSSQEAVAFGVAQESLIITVLSPDAEIAAEGEDATAGMSWDDLVAYYEWYRLEWLSTYDLANGVPAAGASGVVPTLLAQTAVAEEAVRATERAGIEATQTSIVETQTALGTPMAPGSETTDAQDDSAPAEGDVGQPAEGGELTPTPTLTPTP